ncbi:MAG TPA: SPFH domain-containing protein [Verrucomicrobiales bacterium]|jgi:regulator of protease activity HflC (stomatin/prohibitin superfamily)|nr:SPFH domain-containing protein [Verrucomicrobiales bacterium]
MGSLLSLILGLLFFPLTFLGSWVVVSPQEEKLVLIWGSLHRVIKKQGLSFINMWGRRLITISTKRQAMEIHKTTVADHNGNPIIIAAICTYEVVDSVKAALSVEDYTSFIRTQAVAVLKQVGSKYPYESPDGHCLKSEAAVIAQEMVGVLQQKVEVAGIRILSFELSDLSYAPEIAQSMLVRQQAQALISARQIVVEGAVSIVHDAMTLLTQKGVTLDATDRARITGNLLAIICGEAKVQPTFSIQDSSQNTALLERIANQLEFRKPGKE